MIADKRTAVVREESGVSGLLLVKAQRGGEGTQILRVVTSLVSKVTLILTRGEHRSPVPNEPRWAGRERAVCSHHLFLTFIRNVFT